MGSPKIKHYTADNRKTICGRPITIMMRVTTDPKATDISCVSCETSPQLDGARGNITHTGH